MLGIVYQRMMDTELPLHDFHRALKEAIIERLDVGRTWFPSERRLTAKSYGCTVRRRGEACHPACCQGAMSGRNFGGPTSFKQVSRLPAPRSREPR
jgi:hypothetical protein